MNASFTPPAPPDEMFADFPDPAPAPAPAYAHADAPYSVNFYGVAKTGWNLQFTIRAETESDMLDRLGSLIRNLNGMGMTPKQVGQQPAQAAAPTPPAPPANGNGAPQRPPAPASIPASPQPQAQPGAQRFEVKTVAHQVSKSGKDTLTVKGGLFSKFGITAWEEVVPVAFANWPVGVEYPAPAELKFAVVEEIDGRKKVTRFEAG